MYGWIGTVLHIDLSKKTIIKQPLSNSLMMDYVGGRGMNARILIENLPRGLDPLSSDNLLIFATGPYTGTLVPGSCRLTISAKSPTTGLIGDSNICTDFGVELKMAGYDAVIFHGKADKPVYIWIENDTVEIRDAEHIWGKTTWAAQKIIKSELGDPNIPVLCIGPAGENLVKFASIIGGLGRAAGRCGMGTVMGSKLLKAVTVRGDNEIKVAQLRKLEELVSELMLSLAHGKHVMTNGTGFASYKYVEHVGGFAIKNYQTGYLPERTEVTSPEGVMKYVIGARSCTSCPAACNLYYIVDSGPYAGTYGDGFEMTHLQQAGARLGCFNMDVVLKINALTDQYGMDISDFGGVVGLVMECYEKGILTDKDLDGIRPEWGNREAIISFPEIIAYRKGIGNILAEGIRSAAEKIGKGAEKYALHVKGIGFSTVDPRAAEDWGLGYAVASRGACHMRAAFPDNMLYPYCHVIEKKGEIIATFEHIRAFEDSAEICKWIFWGEANQIASKCYRLHQKGESWTLFDVFKEIRYPNVLVDLFNYVTGKNLTLHQMLTIGERIVNLERVFNIREGLTKKDDTLPERFLKEPMPEGPSKGYVCRLTSMLDEYYEVRRWNKETGFPTYAKLKELKLDDFAKDLPESE